MNDFMTVFRILGCVVPKNQRFLLPDESMRAFHNDEIVDEVVEEFQPVGQEFKLIVEDEPVDYFAGGAVDIGMLLLLLLAIIE